MAEFDIHVVEARRAGLSWEVIESIPRGKATASERVQRQQRGGEGMFSLARVKEYVIPLLEKEHDEGKSETEGMEGSDSSGSSELRSKAKEREVAIVLFAAELLETSTVSDETYKRTKRVLDGQDSALVEVTAIVGYYTYVAYTLNVFQIPSSVV